MTALASLCSLTAQDPQSVHPHVAPLAEGFHGPNHSDPDVRAISLSLNFPDGLRNHGESSVDAGGFLSFDDGSDLARNRIHVTGDGPPWRPMEPTSPGQHGSQAVQRFCGHLAPEGDSSIGAAFEIFAPIEWTEPAKRTVVVISMFPTVQDTPAALGGRHGYPGAGSQDGLIHLPDGVVKRPVPYGDVLASYSGTAAAERVNVIAAYIVPAGPGRNLSSVMQHALQLERAIHFILAADDLCPVGWPAEQIRLPVVAAGFSFGALAAWMLPTFFPDRFHGAVSYQFGPSLRRIDGEQAVHRMTTALLGFADPGSGYSPRDRLDWRMTLGQLGSSPGEASFLQRFRRGETRRPQYFLIADEDSVTNGTDWLPILAQQPGYRDNGHHRVASDLFWSRHDASCHEENWFRIPAAMKPDESLPLHPVLGTHDLSLAVLPFLKWARSSQLEKNSGSKSQPTTGPVNRGPAAKTEFQEEDVFDHLLARPTTSSRRAALGSDSTWLTEDSALGVKTRGLGTWLGHHDSTLIVRDPVGPCVIVGSAEGVVSKLRLDHDTRQLMTVAHTESLGYGAWGLAEARFGGDRSVVIAATNRALHRLDVETLVPLGSPVELPARYAQPLHLQITDLFGTGDHLVFHSETGWIVVMNPAFEVVAEYFEPGIVDLVVEEDHPPHDPGWSRPILVQSERGHLVKITLNSEDKQDPCRLLGASRVTRGKLGGLTRLSQSGETRVAALYTQIDSADKPGVSLMEVLELSAARGPGGDNMRVVKERIAEASGGGYGHFEVHDIEAFGEGSLVLSAGVLTTFVGDSPCHVPVHGFAPATWPLDIAVGELDGHGTSPEIIVTTQNGLVVWLDAEAFVDRGELPVFDAQHPYRSTSTGIPAAWGLNVEGNRLRAVDQVGRQWAIDPSGDVDCAQLLSIQLPASDVALPLSKPIQDVVWRSLEPPGLPIVTSEDTIVCTPAGLSGFALWSQVYYPHDPANSQLIRPPDYGEPAWSRMWHSQVFAGRLVPFGFGGDMMRVGGREYLYWFSGNPPGNGFANLLQGVVIDTLTGRFDHWSSTQKGAGLRLRTACATASQNHQSLRLGHWSVFGESTPRIVCATVAGRVFVVDPTGPQGSVSAAMPPKSGDFGFGGMALAVRSLRLAGQKSEEPTIFFGTLTTHADPTRMSADVVASLHLLRRRDPRIRDGLYEIDRMVFDGLEGRPKLWGLAGIAVGDLDSGHRDGDPDDELVVSTLNGDLLVYDIVTDANGRPEIGELLYHDILDGAVGACNSIVITDTDDDSSNEVYVATSIGLRKFVHSP